MSAAFKIDDKVWRRIVNDVNRAAKVRLQIGVLEGENATIAAVHEFGSPKNNIPERSFMRATLINERATIGRLQAKAVAAVIAGKIDGRKALGRVGAWVAGAMQAYVVKGSFAPLAPATLAAREARGNESDKPLVDSGQMVDAITWKVED